MSESKSKKSWWRIPPHLSMKEYCQFVADNLKRVDPEKARRQKEAEERITRCFVYKP